MCKIKEILLINALVSLYLFCLLESIIFLIFYEIKK